MYNINQLSQIELGRQGENLATTVEVDVSEWLAEYPNATINILAQRNGDTAPYIANTSVENGILKWVLTVSDTEKSGRGKAEIRATVDEVIKKSAVAVTYVAPSLEGEPTPTPPEPAQSWVDTVIEAKESIENMSATADVDSNVGTPRVVVTKSEVEGHTNLDFRFYNLKGETGDVGNVDQHYDPTSTKAQSGTAVAEAVSTKQDNMGVEVTQNNLIFDKKPVFLGGAISDSNPISAGYLTRKDYVDTEISNHHDSTKADKSTVDNHIADKSNPHEVTKTQVGLGNVDNTSDLNKPISTAAQAALDLKANSADVYTKTATDTLLDGKENIIRDITPYIDYSVDSQTDEVTIINLKSGVTPNSLVGRFNIPSTIDNKTVTTIGNTCFSNCVNADFILPITLKTIGGSSYSQGAFSDTNISNITLSAGVTLGAGAFAKCLNIKSVYIPDGAILGNGNFFNCANLTQVEFGGSITPNENIFRGCSLYQVILPETLTSIPQSFFYNVTSLKKLYLPKSVNSINIQNSFYNIALTDLYFGGTEAEFNDKTYKTVFTNMSGITIHYNCKPAIMQDIYDYHDSTKQNITDNSLNTTNKTIPTAINEVYAMALGSQTGIAYTDYKSMIDTFNILPADDFFVGKNIYIETVDVPDLWIESNDESSSVPYDIFSHLSGSEAPTFVSGKYYEKVSDEYVVLTTEPANWSTNWTDYYFVDDDSFVNTLDTNGYVQVGYYKLAKLETGKVDLSNYYTQTQTDNLLSGKQNTLTAGANISISNDEISASVPVKSVSIYDSLTQSNIDLIPDENENVVIKSSGNISYKSSDGFYIRLRNEMGTCGIVAGGFGVWLDSSNKTMIDNRVENLDGGPNRWVARNAITQLNLDYAVKAAMTDGQGAAWTDAERLAALLRMGCTVDENGYVKWTAQPTP